MNDRFENRFFEVASATEAMLDRLLQPDAERGEIVRPTCLLEAMRHVVLSPSPRLLPFLLVESAKIFGREDEGVFRAAAAVECVHAYSGVLDGLAGKDNAATSLAGDALLTLAFDILADPAVDPDPLTCAALIGALARA